MLYLYPPPFVSIPNEILDDVGLAFLSPHYG